MDELRLSAVVLLDALGFRGIERRMEPAAVATALSSARKMMSSVSEFARERSVMQLEILGGPAITKVAWFSDTMLLVVQGPEPHRPRDDRELPSCLLDIAAFSTGYMIRAAAQADVPLAFRGVMTIGSALVEDDNIFFGEAIVEASSLYEAADGAFVWLSPEAAAPRAFNFRTGHRPLVPYDIPLKAGKTVRTQVVNPFIDINWDPSARTKIRAGIERAMSGDRLDIAVKRQNTLRFLEHVVATEPAWLTDGGNLIRIK